MLETRSSTNMAGLRIVIKVNGIGAESKVGFYLVRKWGELLVSLISRPNIMGFFPFFY